MAPSPLITKETSATTMLPHKGLFGSAELFAELAQEDISEAIQNPVR
jgi:hypothetical protein